MDTWCRSLLLIKSEKRLTETCDLNDLVPYVNPNPIHPWAVVEGWLFLQNRTNHKLWRSYIIHRGFVHPGLTISIFPARCMTSTSTPFERDSGGRVVTCQIRQLNMLRRDVYSTYVISIWLSLYTRWCPIVS